MQKYVQRTLPMLSCPVQELWCDSGERFGTTKNAPLDLGGRFGII
jgi:hypothetical protein